jgi:hypothetical protein
LISEPCGNDREPSPEGKAAHSAVVRSRKERDGRGAHRASGAHRAHNIFFRSDGAQSFGGAHTGRVCVRVFIWVSCVRVVSVCVVLCE